MVMAMAMAMAMVMAMVMANDTRYIESTDDMQERAIGASSQRTGFGGTHCTYGFGKFTVAALQNKCIAKDTIVTTPTSITRHSDRWTTVLMNGHSASIAYNHL